MPFVKVPGIDREVWIDLHDPQETSIPWFVSAGTQAELSPERFAVEMASPSGFVHTETVVKVEPLGREGLAARVRSAQAHERARRKLIKGHSGRPRAVFGFTLVEDFAMVVLYFESLGHKQAIRKALEYWAASTAKAPSRRHIEKALSNMRGWLFVDLFRSADRARKQHNLPPFPTEKPVRGRVRKN